MRSFELSLTSIAIVLIAAVSGRLPPIGTPHPPPQTNIDVQVTDADNGSARPCRITIVDSAGARAQIETNARQGLAVRQRDIRSPEFARRLESAPEPIRRGFAAYSATGAPD